MRLQFTDRFRRAYGALSEADATRVDKALQFLLVDPRYPSLRTKKMQGTDRVREARVSRSIRLTFEMLGDRLILRNLGAHDVTLKNP